MAPQHEIFTKPLAVAMETEERATPANYAKYPDGAAMGAKMKVWKVQTRTWPEIDPGLVSDGYGFADSPDAEVISGGINSKSPGSVAIGRHGNFFMWGFSGSPSEMTPEARKCFINSVCYIRKFDGKAPLVKKETRSRSYAALYAAYLGDPEMKASQDYILKMFPKELLAACDKDYAKLVTLTAENLEYLRLDSAGAITVDADAKALGISNRKVAILDRCVELLEKGDQAELAQRVLKRYTGLQMAGAGEWKTWLEKNRARLYFTDLGGYKFLVAPEDK